MGGNVYFMLFFDSSLLKYFYYYVIFLFHTVLSILWCMQNLGETGFPFVKTGHWKKLGKKIPFLPLFFFFSLSANFSLYFYFIFCCKLRAVVFFNRNQVLWVLAHPNACPIYTVVFLWLYWKSEELSGKDGAIRTECLSIGY